MSDGAEVASKGGRRDRTRTAGGLVAGLLLVVAGVLAVVGGSGGGGEPEPSTAKIPPRILSVESLVSFENLTGQPVYWLGERAGQELELTQEADESIYLRYLPPGVDAGDPRNNFLTVGTYPVADAQGALRRLAKESNGRIRQLGSGAIMVEDPASPTSAYIAYPGSDIEIEVYHPRPGRAALLISSGAVRPVG